MTKAATELARTFGIGHAEEGRTSETVAREALRQEKLVSHELIDLSDQSIKSFVRIRPSDHSSSVLLTC